MDFHTASNTSSVGRHAIELAVPRNMVVMPLKFRFYLIYSLSCKPFRFMAAILDFRLSGWFHNVGVSTIETLDPKNMG